MKTKWEWSPLSWGKLMLVVNLEFFFFFIVFAHYSNWLIKTWSSTIYSVTILRNSSTITDFDMARIDARMIIGKPIYVYQFSFSDILKFVMDCYLDIISMLLSSSNSGLDVTHSGEWEWKQVDNCYLKYNLFEVCDVHTSHA